EPLAHLVDTGERYARDGWLRPTGRDRRARIAGAILDREPRDLVVDILDRPRRVGGQLIVDDDRFGAVREIIASAPRHVLEDIRRDLAGQRAGRRIGRIDVGPGPARRALDALRDGGPRRLR